MAINFCEKIRYRKGFYFSFDSATALTLIFLAFFMVSTMHISPQPLRRKTSEYKEVAGIGQDTMQVMIEGKLNTLGKNKTENLINETAISKNDLNKSIMENIALLWASGNYSSAGNLSRYYLSSLIPKKYEYRVRIIDESGSRTLYNTSELEKNASLVSTASRMVSGYKKQMPPKGFVSKASLSEATKRDSKFFYFGGYVGEGIVEKNFSLPDYNEITNFSMELDPGSNFSLQINGKKAGNYSINSSKGNLSAQIFHVCSDSYEPGRCEAFNQGNNLIQINFTGNKEFIAGGFGKVSYKKSSTLFNPSGSKVYRFPGINGMVNLYSSFRVPGTLKELETKLHYQNKANSTLFFKMANSTVFRSNFSGENTVELNNNFLESNLSSDGLSYSFLSNKTVPVRLGFQSLTQVMKGSADVILITDVSGSMDWKMNSSNDGTVRDCGDPTLYDSDTQRLSVAKCLDKKFVRKILNTTGNRVGLVSFESSIDSSYGLSSDKSGLISEIENYKSPSGGTCICCAENKAYEMLESQSNKSRDKYVIVMSDGIPTSACDGCDDYYWFWCDRCNSYGTSTSSGCRPIGCGGGSGDCSGTDCIGPMENANYSAWRLHEGTNSTVYSVGFGPVSSCENANKTLRWIANSGNGSYAYSSNASVLENIYSSLAEEIVNISYSAQSVTVEGNASSVLYPDSYLKINYTAPSKLEFGKFSLKQETGRFGGNVTSPKNFTFSIPQDTEIVDSKVTSYSGNYWTNLLKVENSSGSLETIYNLSNYGTNYLELGDPYRIQIPSDKLSSGQNKIQMNTALSLDETKGASPYNRVIYQILVEGSVGYGKTLPKAEGGNITVKSELGSFNITVGSINRECNFSGSNKIPTNRYSEDAVCDSVNRLARKLDLDNNGKIDFKLNKNNLDISDKSVGGVPWMWGPVNVVLEVWKE